MLKLRGIDHVVLRVRDIDVMRRFYCDVLGAEHVAWRPEFRMSHLRAGSSMIDLVIADAASPGRNMDHFCVGIEASDVAEVRRHLEARGVEIAGGPVRVYGARGTGTSLYVRDPERNVVELKVLRDGA